MRAVRKDYFLDHDHSSYVDQWDWEKRHHGRQRNLDFLKDTVRKIWKVIKGAETMACRRCSRSSRTRRYPELPEELDVPARRGDPRDVPRSPAQAARDADHPEVPGGLHHRDRLGSRRTATRTRCAPRTTTTGSRRRSQWTGKDDARPQRRHPGLEPGHEAPPRADLDGHPRHEGDAEAAARDHRADSTS